MFYQGHKRWVFKLMPNGGRSSQSKWATVDPVWGCPPIITLKELKSYFWITLFCLRFLHEVSRLILGLFWILSNACYGRTFWWTHSCILYYNMTLNIFDNDWIKIKWLHKSRIWSDRPCLAVHSVSVQYFYGGKKCITRI